MAKRQLKTAIVEVPHNWIERPYQWPIYEAIVKNGVKRAVCVWHRRSGKDKTFINITVSMMNKRKGTYYYFLPTYNQGKKIIWDGMDKAGYKFLDHIPEPLVLRKNDTEMKLELANGSIFQVVGTDNIDSIMGTNPIGCVFSEYSLQNPKAWEFIRPILLENDGWAIFNFTPRGLNHAKELYDMARVNPDWFCQLLTVDDTKDPEGNRYLTDKMIEDERRSGMSETLIRQEYYCDFLHSIANVLIPYDIIDEAIKRDMNYEHGIKIGGLDIARFGDDSTVLAVRMGGLPTYFDKWQKQDTMETVKRVLDHWRSKKFDVLCVDSIGIGAGVADRLREKNLFPVYDVNVAESSSESDRFSRLRDELWWRVREWFYDRRCKLPQIPYMDAFISSINKITYDFAKGSEKIKIISKADMKELYENMEWDIGDAFMMTFAAPIDSMSADLRPAKMMYQQVADNQYDPFQTHGGYIQ